MEIDLTAEAAYLGLTDIEVATTRDVTEAVLVDIDEFGMVVGVEILDLD